MKCWKSGLNKDILVYHLNMLELFKSVKWFHDMLAMQTKIPI